MLAESVLSCLCTCWNLLHQRELSFTKKTSVSHLMTLLDPSWSIVSDYYSVSNIICGQNLCATLTVC